MERHYTKEEIRKKLILYFKKYKNVDCTIDIKTDLERENGADACVVKIFQRKMGNMFGRVHQVQIPLTEADVNYIFNIILRDEGYELTNLEYNKEIQTTIINEETHETYKRPQFNGITVATREKVKRLVG